MSNVDLEPDARAKSDPRTGKPMVSPGLLVLALVIQASCSAGGSRPRLEQQPEDLAGCYRLELFPDATGPEAEARRAAWNIPSGLGLSTEPLEGWPSMQQRYGEVFAARSYDETGAALNHPFNYWRVAGDSIVAGHPGALAGLQLTLVREGSELRGWVRAFTDVRVGDEPGADTASVAAVRIECPDGG